MVPGPRPLYSSSSLCTLLAHRSVRLWQVERLRIHLTDLERELAVATSGVAQRERRWLDHKEAAARRALAAAASHAAEVGTATRRAAEAEVRGHAHGQDRSTPRGRPPVWRSRSSGTQSNMRWQA